MLRRSNRMNNASIVGTPSGIIVICAKLRAASGISQRVASVVFSHGPKPRVRPSAARKAMAGANTITIHDGTPENFKKMFPIYSTNRFTPDNNHLLNAVSKAGMTISTHPLQ